MRLQPQVAISDFFAICVLISSLFYIFDLFFDLWRPQVGENATVGAVASRQKADLHPLQVGQNIKFLKISRLRP